MVMLELPFPPSFNHCWRNAKRTLLSAKARKYRECCIMACASQLYRGSYCHKTFTGPLAVEITLYPPDRKRRDLDNYAKALLDVCTQAGVWVDDSLVHDLHLLWGEVVKQGKAVVRITEVQK